MTSEKQVGAPSVAILGGGLAGLAAAQALASHGFQVQLFEARSRLGGRAGSYTDPSTGEVIDLCQHVSMGCCTNFRYFCDALGIGHYVEPQPVLYFMTPDRRVSRFSADRLPAPLHLARAFAALHSLNWSEKLRVAWGLYHLRRAARDLDCPFLEWLTRHRQTKRTIDRFWGLVLVSALNESIDRIGFRYARKVFEDGFLGDPRGFVVEVPNVPLSRLYGNELKAWMSQHGVKIQMGMAVRGISIQNHQVISVSARCGESIEADYFISALPISRLLGLLPDSVVEHEPVFRNLRNLDTSPITSVHLWWDRPIMTQPHVVLIDMLSQWVFNRGDVSAKSNYTQVVVSASRSARELGAEVIQDRVVGELRDLFPAAAEARVLKAKVVTEPAATFSVLPGVDRWRPGAVSPIRNLFLAGDWTATGWPATMEGAVRSGFLAAEAVLAASGKSIRCVQPDLGKTVESCGA